MANWNKLTAGQFKAIKTLLRGGATREEACEYMQVSPTTVFYVNKAESFEEYMQLQAERELNRKQVAATKAKAKQEAAAKVAEEVGAMPAAMLSQQTTTPQAIEHRQTVTIQANFLMMEEMKKTNELLKLISNKLAFIVDELCGTPQAK